VATPPSRAENGSEPAVSAAAPSETRAAAEVDGSSGANAASAPPPNVYASTSTLAEETGLMERAIAALHDGDLERARYWLNEHERRFPNGLLARERFRALARVERRAR
jgi:TolA-binding protein